MKNYNNIKVSEFAAWMRDTRESSKISQKELAKIADVGISTIQGLEAGRSKSITKRVYEKIYNALSKPAAKEVSTSKDCSDLRDGSSEKLQQVIMRVATIINNDDFFVEIEKISKKLKIPKLLAMVYYINKEIQK